MDRHSAVEQVLEEIAAIKPAGDAAAALAMRIQRERHYKDARVRTALRDHDEPECRRIAKEAELICTIESSLLSEINAISAGFDSTASEFRHALLALESLQRMRLGLPGCPAIPPMIEGGALDKEQHRSSFDNFAGWDFFLEYFGIVLKSLLLRAKNATTTPDIRPQDVVKATAHFAQSTRWQIFHEFRSFWEQGEVDFDTKALVLDAGQSEFVQAFRISLSRLRTFRVMRSHDRFPQDRVRTGTKELPLQAFRSAEELTSSYLATLQFFSAELKEVVHGASLAEWVRAYHVLREFAWTMLRAGASEDPMGLLVERDPAFFQSLLIEQGGIAERSAKAMIGHLTFGPTSNDLLDCPLIPLGTRLVLLPAITGVMEPAHSLESMLHSIRCGKSHELKFIGPGLEMSVRASLKEGGVHARQIRHGNYECDIAFILDDVLFLCECKCKFITPDFASYANLEHSLRSTAVAQHERTCDFFARHLNVIRHRFGMAPEWEPKSIERIIITSAKLGRPISEDGYWITDHHTVHAYFTRRTATFNVGAKERYKLPDDRLEGPATAEGFLDYLKDPQVITLHQRYLAERRIPLEIGGLRLSFNDCEAYGEVRYL